MSPVIYDTVIRVAKFTAVGVLTFLVVIQGEGEDTTNGIVIDAAGSVYIGGSTKSKDLPS